MWVGKDALSVGVLTLHLLALLLRGIAVCKRVESPRREVNLDFVLRIKRALMCRVAPEWIAQRVDRCERLVCDRVSAGDSRATVLRGELNAEIVGASPRLSLDSGLGREVPT